MAPSYTFGSSVSKLKARLRDNPSGAFAFYGQEELLKQFYLQKFTALIEKEGMAEFNIAKLDFHRDATLPDLLGEAEILPFGGERRLVICRGLNPSKLGDNQVKDLLSLLQNFPSYLTLILYLEEEEFTADKKTTEKKAIKSLAEHLEFVSFPLQDEKTLLSWAEKILERDGLQGDTKALRTLFRLSSNRMITIRKELEKLSAYAMGQGKSTVTEEDVLLFAEDTTEFAVWNLCDAMMDGAVDPTQQILSKLKRQETDPIFIAAAVAKMLTEALLVLEGASPADCSKITKMLPWQYDRYRNSCRGKKKEWVEACILSSFQLNRKLKSYHSDSWVILEVTLLTMTRTLGGLS